MKLEAVDQRFPYFVCVATVMDKNGIQSAFRVINVVESNKRALQ